MGGCTARCFLLLRESQSLLNGRNVIRGRPSEPFQVVVLDVVSQRHLPRFLLMIVQLAELDRVHTQLASHLHLGVGEVMALSRVDPLLHFGVRLSFLRHPIRLASIYLIAGKDRPQTDHLLLARVSACLERWRSSRAPACGPV